MIILLLHVSTYPYPDTAAWPVHYNRLYKLFLLWTGVTLRSARLVRKDYPLLKSKTSLHDGEKHNERFVINPIVLTIQFCVTSTQKKIVSVFVSVSELPYTFFKTWNMFLNANYIFLHNRLTGSNFTQSIRLYGYIFHLRWNTFLLVDETKITFTLRIT